ncbi:MAG: hypothetical protein JEZ04_05460 [Spirochaetales bacterium]|nr:hypothetical protein [Spirochaetales bacterium]
MNKIKEKLRQFMSGRYGMDRLNKILMALTFALIILGIFIQNPVLNALTLAILSWVMFRSYSRNISKRTIENERLSRLLKPLRRNLSLLKLKIKEAGKNRFRSCPNCRVVIRTSKLRGKRLLSCPKCGTQFETRIII